MKIIFTKVKVSILLVTITIFIFFSQQSIALNGLSRIFGLLQQESFEGESFPPQGWSKITNFDGTGWRKGTVGDSVLGMQAFGGIDTAPGGGNSIAYASWATGDADSNQTTIQAADQWLITPKIESIEQGDSVTFYLKYLAVFAERLEILVSTTNADSTASFDTTITSLFFNNGSSNEWQKYSYDLSGFAGQGIYIAFREHVSEILNQGDALLFDLVEVTSLITKVKNREQRPDDFALFQNYPNPFNPTTQISFNLKNALNVTLKVYNLIGQEVAVLLDGEWQTSGRHTLRFNAGNLPNGIYYYKIAAGSFVDTKRMVLLK